MSNKKEEGWVGVNPAIEKFESLSYEQLIPTKAKVFSDKEEEKMLSILQRSLDNNKNSLTSIQADDLIKLMDDLVTLSAKDKLNENTLVKVVSKFETSGLAHLDEIKNYLKIKQSFDAAYLIRNSNNEAAKNSGDVDLSLKLDGGDLSSLSDSQKEVITKSNSKESVLKNNIRLLGSSEELSKADSEAINKLYTYLDSTEKSFDEMSEELRKYLILNTDISVDSKDTISEISKIILDSDTKSISEKIKAENSQDLLNQNFKNLDEKLDRIKTEDSVISKIKQASTAEELGSTAVDSLLDSKLAKRTGAKALGLGKTALNYVKGNPLGAAAKLGGVAAGGFAAYQGYNNLDKVFDSKADLGDRLNSGAHLLTSGAGGAIGGALGGPQGAAYGAAAGEAIASAANLLGEKLSGPINDGIEKMGNSVDTLVDPKTWKKVGNTTMDLFTKGPMGLMADSITALDESMSDYSTEYKKYSKTFKGYVDSAKSTTEAIIDGLSLAGSDIWKSIKTAATTVVDGVKSGYASSGLSGAVSEGVSATVVAKGQISKGIESAKGSLSSSISKHEGNYGSFNRGNAGDSKGGEIDFTKMTVGQIMSLQALPKNNPNRLFAVGKYQVIPSTLKEAVKSLNLKRDEKFTHELQERIFTEFLTDKKRPAIAGFIKGKHDDLDKASLAGSQEWASIEDKRTGRSFYDKSGNNKAGLSAKDYEGNLITSKAKYAELIKRGYSETDAYAIAVGSKQENAELDNLRKQNMPESEVQKTAAMMGIPITSSVSSPKTPTTDTSKINTKVKEEKPKAAAANTSPASVTSSSVTINNTTPISGYNLDAMNHLLG